MFSSKLNIVGNVVKTHAESGGLGFRVILGGKINWGIVALDKTVKNAYAPPRALANPWVVGDYDDCCASRVYLAEQIHDGLSRGAVQRAGRLVGKNYARARDRCTGNGDALLLAA